ncbi:GHMP family kinase ATP-binding protein [Blattabacterium cuenoti]|uniref:GHMP family kinase ATP-binding protein n=1 Tax=Blattabacterium cuenoti TaxID=1653831 RepID=UPI00163C2B35|nr:mevalonate kinase [Blattabacterium cuenoti]
MKNYFFTSKILLFGEYVILENYSGLSIPNHFYTGYLKFPSVFRYYNNKQFNYTNHELRKFAFFLKKTRINIDFNKLYNDLNKGIIFSSNIPKGYGIGSSGALVAAIYHKYYIAPQPQQQKGQLSMNNIIALKQIFSQMESYFHGISSGMDPLICYLNKPILIKSKNDITIVNLPKKLNQNIGKGAIFLLNSGFPKRTYSMIKIFFNKLQNTQFKKIFIKEFIQYNNKCIVSFLQGNFKILFHNIKIISFWILKYLNTMIPKQILKIWKYGLLNNIFYLKLCGSGGGGFTIGFTYDYDLSKKKLKKYQTIVIFRF